MVKTTASASQMARAGRDLCSSEGLVEVSDDVVDILTAYGDTEEPRRDAGSRELGRGVLPVARRGRVRDDRVDAAETGGARAKLERVHEGGSRRESASELEGEHAAAGVEEARGELVLRVAREARVEDALDLRMCLEEAGEGEC